MLAELDTWSVSINLSRRRMLVKFLTCDGLMMMLTACLPAAPAGCCMCFCTSVQLYILCHIQTSKYLKHQNEDTLYTVHRI